MHRSRSDCGGAKAWHKKWPTRKDRPSHDVSLSAGAVRSLKRLNALDVLGAGPFRALLFSEFDGVPFLEVFERTVASVAVEEKIISLGSDEAEAFVCDDFLDGSLRHDISMDWYCLTLLALSWSQLRLRPSMPVTANSLSYSHRSGRKCQKKYQKIADLW